MKKLILLFVIAGIAGAAYWFLFQGPLKTDFEFEGQHYQHVEKRNAGDILNHNYTPNGEPAASAHHAIQILEFSESILKKDWDKHLSGIFAHYNLIRLQGEDDGWYGQLKNGKVSIKVYAAPIKVENEDHIILYISLNDGKKETLEEKLAFIKKLKAIQTTFK